MLIRQRDPQRVDVRMQVLYLASADDGKDVWVLLHHIRDSHCTQGLAR